MMLKINIPALKYHRARTDLVGSDMINLRRVPIRARAAHCLAMPGRRAPATKRGAIFEPLGEIRPNS
jgi:hypothetical protein